MARCRCEILTVGDELLRGEITDTNSSWLAGELNRLGTEVIRTATVGDTLPEIVGAIGDAAARCEILLVTGGLGPTADDVTARAVAQAAAQPLRLDKPSLEAMQAHFARLGVKMSPNNEQQAWIPELAEALPNRVGTAPGIALRLGTCTVFVLPGVPSEMQPMFSVEVASRLQQLIAVPPASVTTLRVFAWGESDIDEQLATLDLRGDDDCRVSLHFKTTFPENHVIVVVRPSHAAAAPRAQQIRDRLCQQIQERLGSYCFGTLETPLPRLVLDALRQQKLTLAAAESCTGGLIADLLTDVSGASDVFRGSLVVYQDDSKKKWLGVPAEILENYGAVSEETARAMAEHVRQQCGDSAIGLAVTGLAGPMGDERNTPVGTVHFAVASKSGVSHCRRRFPYDRRKVKVLSAHVALWLTHRFLSGVWPGDEDPLRNRWT